MTFYSDIPDLEGQVGLCPSAANKLGFLILSQRQALLHWHRASQCFQAS